MAYSKVVFSLMLAVLVAEQSNARRPYFSDEDDEVENGETGSPLESESPKVKREPMLANSDDIYQTEMEEESEGPIPCTCGIYLMDAQLKHSKKPPVEEPVFNIETEDFFPDTTAGTKQCTKKCMEEMVKHLPSSPKMICSAVDHDIFKKRACLWVKNYKDEWHNSNLSAGREYCCKDNESYKCPSSRR